MEKKSFFFADGEYHRQGIGTRLFKTVLKDYPERTVNGIRFTPMQWNRPR